MKPCKFCGTKLGCYYVIGNFCSFDCRSKWKKLQRKAEVNI